MRNNNNRLSYFNIQETLILATILLAANFHRKQTAAREKITYRKSLNESFFFFFFFFSLYRAVDSTIAIPAALSPLFV